MKLKTKTPLEMRTLISRLLDSDPGITTFLFESPRQTELRDSPARLLENTWELENEDRVLVRAALDLWNGSGQVFLSEALTLNEPAFSRLLTALRQTRSRRRSP